MNLRAINSLCERYGAEFLTDTPIAPYTSFKIGGKCNIIKINGVKLLRDVLMYCHTASAPYHILGKGSNVLIGDKGLKGIVLLFTNDGFGKIDFDGNVLKCQAGASLSAVCKSAVLRSLAGMEFAYGIPGTIGGALYMNAGAYGGEISQIVDSCAYIDFENIGGKDDDLPVLKAEDMKLGYRDSVFREKKWIITRVKLRLKYDSRVDIKSRMDEVTEARKDKQPLDYPSAGSTFKRPEGHFAAKLIEDCGLKGKSVGNAFVSEKHCGFIVNKGGATCDDVLKLIELVKEEVLKQTGVTLEPEVQVWK